MSAHRMTAEEVAASEFTSEFLGRYEDDYLRGDESARDAFLSDCEAYERAALAEQIAARQIEEYGVSVEADERVSTHCGGTFREMLEAAARAGLEANR